MRSGMHTGCAMALMYIALLSAMGNAVAFRQLQDGGCTEPYGQCGGQTCSNGAQSCTDSAYTCCPSNYSCQRQSQWYWQCQPAAATYASGAPTMSPPASPLISSSEEISPESAPEEISPEAAPEEIDPCALAYEENPPYYVFTSYLDNSGEHAPDGIYKETCRQIDYDCTIDTITASCPTDATMTTFTNSSFPDATDCYYYGAIANVGGVLTCDTSIYALPPAAEEEILLLTEPEPEPESEGEGEPEPEGEGETEPEPEAEAEAEVNAIWEAYFGSCGSNAYQYHSKFDDTGLNAPDGSYKEFCRQIGYDCNTDTVYAECDNGAEGSAQNWPLVSLADATLCYDITSSNGGLQCVAYADSDGDT